MARQIICRVGSALRADRARPGSPPEC